jgi:hypothetical protein
MATVFDKAGEKVTILSVREALIQPFTTTPPWLDLRIGFFLSVTQAAADDTITGLAETIGSDPNAQVADSNRFFVGLLYPPSTFMGYTNRGSSPSTSQTTSGRSKLVSSDLGIGVTNTNFWRPTNELTDYTMQILDSWISRVLPTPLSAAIHFPQNTAGAGGYATLLMLRFQRDDYLGRAKIIRMSAKITPGGNSSDVLFSNTPSKSVLESNLAGFPTTVQQLGPVQLSVVPDKLYLYWPFNSSRLRIHAASIYRAA